MENGKKGKMEKWKKGKKGKEKKGKDISFLNPPWWKYVVHAGENLEGEEEKNTSGISSGISVLSLSLSLFLSLLL